jgi:arylsulfatase A-like enzyme
VADDLIVGAGFSDNMQCSLDKSLRRIKMIRVAIPVTVLLLACQATSVSNSASQTSPNVLLVIADDFGIDASPCYSTGKNKPNMPNLESLCKKGVVFDNVWVNPVCAPTRASILTGRYGFRTKVGSVGDVLDSDQSTIFDALNKQGVYSSAVIGKWHVAPLNDIKHPGTLGVPYYAGFLQGALKDYNSIPLIKDGATTNITVYSTTVFTDLAVSWVKQQTKPWFLWLAYNAPHTPFHLPLKNLISNQNLTGAANDIRSNPQAYYFAAAEALDAEMGRLLKSVDLKNTVIFFVGDNGTPAQVTQYAGDRFRAKGSVYQGGVEVPLVISGPDKAPENRADWSTVWTSPRPSRRLRDRNSRTLTVRVCNRRCKGKHSDVILLTPRFLRVPRTLEAKRVK